MRVYAFVNQKGGVGKTTSCANIGAALVMAGRRVLLIDLDPQANLTTSLGIRLKPDQADIYDVLKSKGFRGEAQVSIKDILINRTLDLNVSGGFHMHVAPAAPLSLAKADIEFSQVTLRETLLKRILEPLEGEYDYILIDCSPSVGILTTNAMAAADQIIIPVQSQYLSLEGMGQIIQVLEEIEPVNPDLSIGGIIVTMFDKRLIINREVREILTDRFADFVFEKPIRTNISVSEAPSSGMTIFEYAPSSHGSEDYLQVTQELLNREANYAKTEQAA